MHAVPAASEQGTALSELESDTHVLQKYVPATGPRRAVAFEPQNAGGWDRITYECRHGAWVPTGSEIIVNLKSGLVCSLSKRAVDSRRAMGRALHIQLPDDLRDDLELLLDETNLELKRGGEDSLEKFMHFYPLLVSAGLERAKEMDVDERRRRAKEFE